jgi:hypothetical protein
MPGEYRCERKTGGFLPRLLDMAVKSSVFDGNRSNTIHILVIDKAVCMAVCDVWALFAGIGQTPAGERRTGVCPVYCRMRKPPCFGNQRCVSRYKPRHLALHPREARADPCQGRAHSGIRLRIAPAHHPASPILQNHINRLAIAVKNNKLCAPFMKAGPHRIAIISAMSYTLYMRMKLPFQLQTQKVYAFVGESGTGKSFHAKLVAQKYRISLIIDDGLLIKDSRIIAGRSAKEEKTYMGAVRVALFGSEEQRREMSKRLVAENFRKLLILGTSNKMVDKIASQLGLPKPGKIIRIEDIADRDEIERALRTRRIEGKHIIPAPQAEVKRNYADIFFGAVRVRRKKLGPQNIVVTPVHEKSLVRPLYSRRERIKISEVALSEMAILSITVFDADIKVKRVDVTNTEYNETSASGYRLVLLIDLPNTWELSDMATGLQRHIIEDIERFTGILIEEVIIVVDKSM